MKSAVPGAARWLRNPLFKFRNRVFPGAAMSEPNIQSDIQVMVKQKYGAAAKLAAAGGVASCGGGAELSCCDPITKDLYDSSQIAGLPEKAVAASLGCGNPTALVQLQPGETVLDLGSGGGIDVLLSAKRVGPTGKAYGLDMTDEMLALANENKARAGASNVEFLRGHIESIPLPSNTVDVIISNCVINLSGDKRKVLAEAFRVLKPGGRFAVSDVVVRGDMPPEVRQSAELSVRCVARALDVHEFLSLRRDVGVENASIEPTREYAAEDAAAFLANTGLDAVQVAKAIDGRIMSAFVRATKP